jgi:hypothetical protein
MRKKPVGKPVRNRKVDSKVESRKVESVDSRERQTKRILRPAGCRSYMRKELAEEFPEIVEGFVEAAKTGSVPHVKLATELLKPTRKGTTRRKGSVAKLLEKLGKDEPERYPSEMTQRAKEADHSKQ